MRVVLNAVLLVVLASASHTEIKKLRAEQVELAIAARTVCNDSMELLRRLSFAKDEPNKGEALGLRAKMKELITGLDTLVSQAPLDDWRRNVEVLAFASGVLKKSIEGMDGILSRVSVYGKGFNSAFSEKRTTLKEMDSRVTTFIHNLQLTLNTMAQNSLPSVEIFLKGNIQLVRTTLQLITQIRLITVDNDGEPELRALGELVDRLVEPLHGFMQDMTGWLSQLHELFKSDVKRLVVGVVENSSRGAEAMIESLGIIRNHLTYFNLEGLRSDLENTESEWRKVKSTCSLLDKRYKRITSGIQLPDEDEMVRTTTPNIDIEAFEAPVNRPKPKKKAKSTTTTSVPTTSTTLSTSTTTTVAKTTSMDLMDEEDESEWTEVKNARQRMKSPIRFKIEQPRGTEAGKKAGSVVEKGKATASIPRPTTLFTSLTTPFTSITTSESTRTTTTTTTSTSSTTSSSSTSTSPSPTTISTTTTTTTRVPRTRKTTTSTTSTTPTPCSTTTSSSTSPATSTATGMKETPPVNSIEPFVSTCVPTTETVGPIATIAVVEESRERSGWTTKQPVQGRGPRRGRYNDQQSSTSSVLIAPAVASISIQISSHADSLSLLINQIWMLNQHASAVPPSQEAYQVLVDYQYDIEVLMEHINNFRLKTQQIVAYTHSIPAIAFPM